MTARAWIRLPSGKHLDLINPDPGDWDDRDLSIRISRTYRWGGESSWDRPLSVAQHSLLVLALFRRMATTPPNPMEELFVLLHDSEEAWLGFDCISPLKPLLGKAFADVCERLTEAIRVRYRLSSLSDSSYALYKEADWIAAASEAIHCVGWSEQELRNTLQIPHPVLRQDPLSTIYAGTAAWEPWAPSDAEQRFHRELCKLMGQVR
jgi:uncharacterized protein